MTESSSFAPYRRLTDDELLDVLFLSGFKNESEAIDLPAAERNARLALREKNGCPLSMELTYMNTSYDYGKANGHWGRIPFVTLMFEYVDEAGAHWNADAFINGVTSQTTGHTCTATTRNDALPQEGCI